MRRRRLHRPRYRFRLLIGGGLVLTLLSILFVSKVTFFGVWPDIVTLYALFFVLYGNHKEGGYLPVMLLGLVRDIFSIGTLGTYAILYGILHKLLAGRKGLAFRENPLMLMALGGFSVLFVNFGAYLAMVVQGYGSGFAFGLKKSALMAGMSAPLMPVLVVVMAAAMAFLQVEETKEGCYNI